MTNGNRVVRGSRDTYNSWNHLPGMKVGSYNHGINCYNLFLFPRKEKRSNYLQPRIDYGTSYIVAWVCACIAILAALFTIIGWIQIYESLNDDLKEDSKFENGDDDVKEESTIIA